jgi:hypothetical protein
MLQGAARHRTPQTGNVSGDYSNSIANANTSGQRPIAAR